MQGLGDTLREAISGVHEKDSDGREMRMPYCRKVELTGNCFRDPRKMIVGKQNMC